jgi:membrane protease YdiL (CAAX protease family)
MAAFACGIFWGWLCVATDDLVVPVVSHLVWDLALFFAFPVVQ